ncbi:MULTISPECIES: DNA cytosine methyltransferase [unclassified Streptomyces]|uniref:DNA cytosine methyltransferase n=1 Tax=unclassified Streptomyces TaxID=2593676 RepID=UPI001BECE25F|nr:MULTISPECIES: DNA (cytosine-5-)-methyltransferase [unclassified Streptomyces]MBT2402645.1 DNA (cytosine-5-)-methyltransferase [Streptomyces sp. ISL-21]MBT2608038.1 DNA (cytosine-5-)-methyltransferase [Streptomyces sp. ISL-87]
MGASDHTLTSIEICAGAGGQAIGLHQAGFRHLALVEIDQYAAATLRRNIDRRDGWEFEREYCDIIHKDVNHFEPLTDLERPVGYLGGPLKEEELDLLAGGVPCPPFSHAGKQLGKDDERDLFPRMLELVDELKPKAVMIENVRGIKDDKFQEYRDWVIARLEGGLAKDPQTGEKVEYEGSYTVCGWEVLEASDFGVPQLRPRAILVAIRTDVLGDRKFEWPVAKPGAVTVRAALGESMKARFKPFVDKGGVLGAKAEEALKRWEDQRDGIAPTLVGGSKKHGGADLGPSRAKAAWKLLGVNAMGVANSPDEVEEKKSWDRDLFRPEGPMLTVTQAAVIQGFPEAWDFAGDKKTEKPVPGKTAQYRQVGNAFPPPVAHAVGESIAKVLRDARPAAQAGS